MFGSNPRATSAPESPSPASSTNGNYQANPPSRSAANRLSSDVSIQGDVTFASELLIDGQVKGNITSDGTLVIGEHGTVTGDIEVGTVNIHGSVKGNVRASERCALENGASLEGDVEAPRLAVDENATFIGSATITAKKR